MLASTSALAGAPAATAAGEQRVQWILNLASGIGRVLMLGEGEGAAPDEEYIMVDSGASRAT